MPFQSTQTENILELHVFQAEEDFEYRIQASRILFMMPIFRWIESEQRWADAIGFYDLCMSPDGRVYYFYSRMPGKETFGFRYVSSFFPQSGWQEKTFSVRGGYA